MELRIWILILKILSLNIKLKAKKKKIILNEMLISTVKILRSQSLQ